MPGQTSLQIEFLSGGKTIRVDAVEPARSQASAILGRRPAILLLHGAGGNTGFWLERMAPMIAAAGVGVYAVHYFDRTGTVRADLQTLSDGVHVPLWLATIEDAVRHIAARDSVDPRRVALVGISLGAFLSLALAAVNPGLVRAAVDLSGGLVAPYAGSADQRFPPTLIVHGEADTVVSISHARTLDALLTRLGVAHRTTILAGEGHWFSAAAQLRILAEVSAFLQQHLFSGSSR